ncbi:gamma-glutamyltransferase [Cellulomonas sp. ATA003]|nr:gamma-glutamyltransferase [Cellulomonas sp. ATA003]WNB85414.1 gamma-glutamyltransferase [Cellulomonas sp. ATA003]
MRNPNGPVTGRPPVRAERGMVATSHYLASATGLHTLRRGGSAADALIAANAVLCVAYPHMAGLGGDAFALVHRPGGPVQGLNASGPAAALATRDRYREWGHTEAIPSRGARSALTVPGAVDGWRELHERHGRLEWSSLFDDAVHLARSGVPVSRSLAEWSADDVPDLRQQDLAARTFLPGGRAPREGSGCATRPWRRASSPSRATVRAPASTRATSPSACAPPGRRRLPVARGRPRRLPGRVGGPDHHPLPRLRRLRDAAQHPGLRRPAGARDPRRPRRRRLRRRHRGLPPPRRGGGEDRVRRSRRVADRPRQPRHPAGPAPRPGLPRRAPRAHRARDVPDDGGGPPGIAAPGSSGGDVGGDTCYLCAVDSDGLAVSLIQSVYHDFGSAFVAGDTGILLQNRGSFFSLDDAHPNRLEPGKRSFHTLIPGMLLEDGEPDLVYGTMGGEGQPQTHAALVTRLVDFGYDVQQAIEAPRWLMGRTWGTKSLDLSLEGRVPDGVIRELERRGQPVKVLADWDDNMGHAQAIRIDRTSGYLEGGADPRGDGLALGY